MRNQLQVKIDMVKKNLREVTSLCSLIEYGRKIRYIHCDGTKFWPYNLGSL